MGYREDVTSYLTSLEVGEVKTTAEIKKKVSRIYGTEYGSIIPSDYCYNITNKDPQSYITDGNPRLLEQVKRGYYRYLGLNYKYNGVVTHKKIPVGEWVNGIYHPYKY